MAVPKFDVTILNETIPIKSSWMGSQMFIELLSPQAKVNKIRTFCLEQDTVTIKVRACELKANTI